LSIWLEWITTSLIFAVASTVIDGGTLWFI
jgi:hypothetical protein